MNPGHFVVKSFHIFLLILILVGWAVLPLKQIVPYIITIWFIPISWIIYNECIITSAENEYDPPRENNEFTQKLMAQLGLNIDKQTSTGIGLLLLSLVTFLAARRII